MENMTSPNDNLDINDFERAKIPTGLNVLTILTFIGCALYLYGVITGFTNAKTTYDKRDEMITQMNSDKVPGFMKSIMPDAATYDLLITKSYENRLPIFILGLISLGLCVIGAVQMRKRKKQGFLLYTIGELLPVLTTGIFIGTAGLTGFSAYILYGISLLFILLYASYRKHMIY